jgi:putative oxidoreductase
MEEKTMNLNAGGTREWGLTVLRIVTGIVFFAHGLQKLTEFGVGGFAGFLTSLGIPLPGVFAVIVIAVELLGGLALILGLGTRWVALPLAIDMLVALFTVHLPNGFFAQNNGYELVLILLAASVALALTGSGALALDNLLGGRVAGTRSTRVA